MEAEKKHQQQQEEQVENKCLIPGLPDDIGMECLIRVPHEFHSNMKSVCLKWQYLISDPSFYHQRLRSNTAEHLVYQIQLTHIMIDDDDVISSSQKKQKQKQKQTQHITPPPLQYGLTMYNATYQTWQRMIPNFEIPIFCQCVTIQSCGNSKLVLLGGWDPKTLEPVSDVYVLDIVKGWRKGAFMSVARSFFACAVVGGTKVYVGGGHENQKNALKSAQVCDVDKDEWGVLPEMEEERDEYMGMCWDDRFWVVGGYGTETEGRFRSDGECFDPATASWSKVHNLWPFQSSSPKCNTTSTRGGKQCEWPWFLGNEQQFEHEEERRCSIVQLPNSVIGSVSMTALGLGDRQCNQKVFVMSANGSSLKKCNDCESEGAFILERDTSNGNTKWHHVHTPLAFSEFPYSTCHLLI